MTEPWRESYDDWKLRGPDDDAEIREQRYFDACDEDYDGLYDDEDRREMDADRKVDDERN